MKARGLLGCLAALSMSGSTFAQQHGDFTLWGSRFGADESTEYGGFRLNLDASPQTTLSFRMDSSPFKTFNASAFSIERGGKDREFMAIFGCERIPGLCAGLGIAAPDTPARGTQALGTFDANYARDWRPLSLKLGFKGLIGSDSVSLASVGASLPFFRHGLSLAGDIGEPVWGSNTRSVSNGGTQRTAIGSLGLRFEGPCQFHAQLDWTNSIGETTGFSMTPALGNRYGLRLELGKGF